MTLPSLSGYARADGRKGIRNVVVVAYLVECAHHVAREIAESFRDHDVHLVGFPGCYPNPYAREMLERLCTHPNVGAALLVSLGCEGFDRHALRSAVAASGRPVHTLGIQDMGGTRKTIEAGRDGVEAMHGAPHGGTGRHGRARHRVEAMRGQGRGVLRHAGLRELRAR